MEDSKKKQLTDLLEYMFDHPDENGYYYVDYWEPDKNDEELNPFEWKAVINGPIGSPYEGGYYKLKVTFKDDFPISGPIIKFITKIYHCNISDNGDICLNIIKYWDPKKWDRNKTMDSIFKSIYDMLIVQNPKDSYCNRGDEYLKKRDEFNKKAREYRDKYARLNQL